MKHLKLFEKFGDDIKKNSKYKVNDYILFYDEDDKTKQNGKILELFIKKGDLWYEVAMVEGDEIGSHTSILDGDIYRLLTPEEIRQIEIRNTAKKYNL